MRYAHHRADIALSRRKVYQREYLVAAASTGLVEVQSKTVGPTAAPLSKYCGCFCNPMVCMSCTVPQPDGVAPAQQQHQAYYADACSSNMLLPKCTVCLVQICSHNILGQMQLDDVWFCLLRHATKGADSPDDSRLHYDDFCQVMHLCTLQTHPYTCAYNTPDGSFWLVYSLFTVFASLVNDATAT